MTAQSNNLQMTWYEALVDTNSELEKQKKKRFIFKPSAGFFKKILPGHEMRSSSMDGPRPVIPPSIEKGKQADSTLIKKTSESKSEPKLTTLDSIQKIENTPVITPRKYSVSFLTRNQSSPAKLDSVTTNLADLESKRYQNLILDEIDFTEDKDIEKIIYNTIIDVDDSVRHRGSVSEFRSRVDAIEWKNQEMEIASLKRREEEEQDKIRKMYDIQKQQHELLALQRQVLDEKRVKEDEERKKIEDKKKKDEEEKRQLEEDKKKKETEEKRKKEEQDNKKKQETHVKNLQLIDSTEAQWELFFFAAGLPQQAATEYTQIFIVNDIELSQISDITSEILKDLGFKIGHSLKIMKYINTMK